MIANLCVVIFLATAVIGQGENRYLSCTQLSSYCLSHGSAQQNIATSAHLLHRPGKAGAKGEKGDTGPAGPAVEVDYEGIERRILLKVKEMIINCRVVYNDSCFVLVGATPNKYSKEDLQRKCELLGGNLANLYNEEHRIKVSQYVRSEMGVYVQIALGMTYNPQANTFRTTAGETKHIQFKWHPTYPKKEQIHQNMFFSVQTTAGSASQGAFNHEPYSESFGLCEYPIGI
ncbi:uncharacterized protein LOC144429736 isoform X2 [Styela clava]